LAVSFSFDLAAVFFLVSLAAVAIGAHCRDSSAEVANSARSTRANA